MTTITQSFNEAIQHLHKQVGNQWVVGTPLGIGKPNPLINALYDHAVANQDVSLDLFTALSLALPRGKSLLEQRFLAAFNQRFFGHYPELKYLPGIHQNDLPDNITVREFYMQSGQFLGNPTAQQHYVSSNYTHVARDMVDREVNVILQMVAVRRVGDAVQYSLSSNPDLTLDIIRVAEQKGKPRPVILAMVNEHMPFMGGQAAVNSDFFDVIVDDRFFDFEPFATPAQAISDIDYNIGLMASTLVKDGGTLQIGIGSLADALVYSAQLRQQNNATYQQLLDDTGIMQQHQTLIKHSGAVWPFEQGLYAASEMFVEGFAHLYDAGILKRRVYPDVDVQNLLNSGTLKEQLDSHVIQTLLEHGVIDEHLTFKQFKRLQNLGILKAELQYQQGRIVCPDGVVVDTHLRDAAAVAAIENHCLGTQLQQGVILHAAFFMGSKRFYAWLRGLNEQEHQWFQMTPVSQINELYGGEALDRAQRVKSRFFNTCMKVDVLGAAASDTLENQQVVSGVGGQYNFVAMAHALADSRSVLMLRSVHNGSSGPVSNIVWQYGYCTIPRHLRDVVITEYGMADLRGQSDETCIKRMICIADSRFQESLRTEAVKHHKLSANWQVPEAYQQNLPARIKTRLLSAKNQGYFPEYPFGQDFTGSEQTIIKALKWLKFRTRNKPGLIKTLLQAWLTKPAFDQRALLEMMQLQQAQGMKEKVSAKLLTLALNQTHD